MTPALPLRRLPAPAGTLLVHAGMAPYCAVWSWQDIRLLGAFVVPGGWSHY